MTASTRTTASGLTAGARYATVAVAWLFAIGGVVQVFLAGMSVFESWSYWFDHVDLGRMLALPALLLPLLGFAGRIGVRLGIMAALVTALYIAQMALANLNNGSIAAFHAVNALVLIGLASSIGRQALALVRTPYR